jgi:glycerol-3-phosphate acyltransferase PlsY
MSMIFMALLLFSYVCGSIPFAKIVGFRYGIDIQKQGSGNIGFANVVRVLGWRAGLMVLPGDILKGFIPVILAQQYLGLDQVLAVGLAAIAGHVFPIWLRFRGGKGIATGLGVTLAISPVVGGLGLLVYLLGFVAFRKSAPSSIVAAWSLPLLCLAFYPKYALFYLGLALVTVWTHRNNIQQLRKRAADVA